MASQSGKDFLRDIKKWSDGTRKETDEFIRAVTLALFRSIILATPVDTGRARGNWQTSVRAPASGELERFDKGGSSAIADVTRRMGGLGQVTYLTNNLPYIGMLEYGGYPAGPKTIRGYSRQAPRGMVRINLVRIARLLKSGRPK